MPQPLTGRALPAEDLVRFENELSESLRALAARLQETPELDDISVAVRSRSEEAHGEIEAALSRLQDGSFGKCESCLTAIGRDRLEAMPHTRYCLGCAHRERAR